jgi:hypothetical protein
MANDTKLQGKFDLSDVRSMPLTPAMLGRIAGRKGWSLAMNPFPYQSAEYWAWFDAWGLAHGIPNTLEASHEYLRKRFLALYDVLEAIRDNPAAPADVREQARRVLAREEPAPAEVREG